MGEVEEKTAQDWAQKIELQIVSIHFYSGCSFFLDNVKNLKIKNFGNEIPKVLIILKFWDCNLKK